MQMTDEVVTLDELADHTELFKQFNDNPNFKRWLRDTVFDVTYRAGNIYLHQQSSIQANVKNEI